jgi:hypothetical protein
VPIAYLKLQLNDFNEVAFFDAQDEENDFVGPLDTSKHRFIDDTKVVFLRRPECRKCVL